VLTNKTTQIMALTMDSAMVTTMVMVMVLAMETGNENRPGYDVCSALQSQSQPGFIAD